MLVASALVFAASLAIGCVDMQGNVVDPRLKAAAAQRPDAGTNATSGVVERDRPCPDGEPKPAATGKPSIPGLPWEPTEPETNQSILWDNDCRMVNDPEGEARKIILS